MAFLTGSGQLLLLTSVLFQHVASFPISESSLEDVRGLSRSEVNDFDSSPLLGDYMDAVLADKQSLSRRPGLQTRQLGDIEFSNRYAEYLRSKAKLSTICSYLRRMQNVKKSGIGGDAERVNLLVKQYSCPGGYQWVPES